MMPILLTIDGQPIDVGLAILAMIAGFAFLLALGIVLLLASARARRRAERDARLQARMLEARVADLLKEQSEMTGRMQTMAEVFGSRQGDIMRAVNDRLDGMSHKIGQSMAESGRRTHDGLRHLHERLAVIDRAQTTIRDLSGQVSDLRAILSNKQTRGAFGQGRMEALIQDALPPGGYSFQASLSTGARPDCLIHLPNGAAPLVIDAKFPLEAHSLLNAADDAQTQKRARAQFRRDIGKHLTDIRERYLLPGETQDTAFMFVPSESVFAQIHEQFDDLVQRAHKLRVVIVSPSLLMLSVQVVQSILKDARMREEAHRIQAQVAHLIEDVTRLGERSRALQRHFGQATQDLDKILISTEKIGKRGHDIVALDLGSPSGECDIPGPAISSNGIDARMATRPETDHDDSTLRTAGRHDREEDINGQNADARDHTGRDFIRSVDENPDPGATAQDDRITTAPPKLL